MAKLTAGRKITQNDVARVAGVSQATVSLVLTGSPDSRVSDETRSRVLEAIRRTSYVANPLAQALAGGRSRIFGVFTYEPVFPVGPTAFYQPFLAGIEAEAERSGVDLLLYTSARVENGRRRLLAEGWDRLRVTDGCILIGRHEHRGELERLVEGGFPFVFVGRRELHSGIVPYVGADYRTATAEVVRRLVALSHERIAYLGDTSEHETAVDRISGYRDAMTAAGLVPLVFDYRDFDAQSAVELALKTDLTALVLGADYVAEEVRLAAVARGVSVPSDLSIATLGESERHMSGPLEWSGFRTPRAQMGEQAVRLLAQFVMDPDVAPRKQILLGCQIVEGETIAPRRK